MLPVRISSTSMRLADSSEPLLLLAYAKYGCRSSSFAGPEVTKLYSCSIQLSVEFILLINVKMPKIVGILTFISRITTCEGFKTRDLVIFHHLTFYEHLKFHAQLC